MPEPAPAPAPAVRPRIAVVGPGAEDAGERALADAGEIGRLLGAAGDVVVLTGGLGGVMAATAAAAAGAGALTVGVLPGTDPATGGADVAVPLASGLDQARNAVVVNAAHAVVAVAPSPGTLAEVALAARAGTPVTTVGRWALPAEVASPALGRRGVHAAGTAPDAARWAIAAARLGAARESVARLAATPRRRVSLWLVPSQVPAWWRELAARAREVAGCEAVLAPHLTLASWDEPLEPEEIAGAALDECRAVAGRIAGAAGVSLEPGGFAARPAERHRTLVLLARRDRPLASLLERVERGLSSAQVTDLPHVSLLYRRAQPAPAPEPAQLLAFLAGCYPPPAPLALDRLALVDTSGDEQAAWVPLGHWPLA